MSEEQPPKTERTPSSTPPSPNPSKRLSEHPLTITFVSFLLTGIIGASITYVVQRRNADSERDARHYEASTTAIAAFSDSLSTRYTRAGFLTSALRRHAKKDEVMERKKLYDDSVVAQESHLFGQELLIREALQETQYTSFESLYDTRVRLPFHRLDDLLTKATDEYLKNANTNISFDPIHQAYEDSRDCSYALVNLVFLDVGAKQYLGSSGKKITSREEAEQDFNAKCPAQSVP